MKRFLTILFTTLLLTAALCVSASASDFDAAAEDLAAIGMFRGTASGGYALDRAPTRSEAAIMLVRLYGAEEEAAAKYASKEITHPFTDVGGTAAPYVAWLYTNGISNGVSETAFGASRPCTAQSYVVFLLRALGYQDGQDFQYEDAAGFAAAKGLFDPSVFSGTFLRDDLAAVTYQALGCDLKDGSTYLLDSLIKSGAVDASAAKPITSKIETYRALMAYSANLGSALDIHMDAKAEVAMSLTGVVDGEPLNQGETMPITYQGRIQMVLDEKPQMAVTMTGSAMGESIDIGMWLKDGWMYSRQNGSSYKTDVSEELDSILASYQELLEAGTGQMSASMLPFIDTITSSRSGGDTVYTLALNSAFGGMIHDLFGMMGGALDTLSEGYLENINLSVDLSNCSYTYTVGSNGNLKHVTAGIEMDMSMDLEEDAENQLAMSLGMDLEMDLAVNASGSAVKVTYPADLSQFPILIGGADGPTAIVSVGVV